MQKLEIIPFPKIIKALLDIDTPFSPQYLYRLSSLPEKELAQLKEVWGKIAVQRRQNLMEDIKDLGEDDPLLSFDGISIMALDDPDERVREMAVKILWEYDEKSLLDKFISFLQVDKSSSVRAAAASAIGKYIYLGEIDELSPTSLNEIEELLLSVCQGEDTAAVRRGALESLGYSGRKEVALLIENAYRSGDEEWQSSALFAMGRSADEKWIPNVKAMMKNKSADLRYEAARAAGELEAKECLARLIALSEDDDANVRMVAVWSLSQIGGEGVRDHLEELLKNCEDGDELDLIDSALENLVFTEDMDLFSMMDIEDEDEFDLSNDDDYLDDDEDELD